MALSFVIFKSFWYARHFDVHVQLKTTGTAIKIVKETANNQ